MVLTVLYIFDNFAFSVRDDKLLLWLVFGDEPCSSMASSLFFLLVHLITPW